MNSARRAFVLSLLPLVAGAGCAPISPRVMSPVSVMAPMIPSMPRILDPEALGYARGHQLLRLAGRLELDGYTQQAARIGINLGDLRSDETYALLVGKPTSDTLTEMPLALYLPLPSTSPIGQALAIFAPGPVTAVGNSTLMQMNLPRTSKMGEEVQAIAAAPLGNDLEVYIHQSSVMARWGAKLRAALAKSQADLSRMNGSDPRMNAAVGEWLLAKLDALESVAFGVVASDSTLELSSIQRDKPGSAKAPSASARNPPELARFLPMGDVRIEVGVQNLKSWSEAMLKLYAPMLEAYPETHAQWKAFLSEWFGTGARNDMGMSLSFDPQRGIVASAVMQSSDAGKHFDLIEKGVALVSSEPFAVMYARQGIKMEIKLQKAVRQIHGWPVNRMTYNVIAVAGAKPIPPDLQKFLPLSVEVVRLGSHLVYAVNQNAGGLEALVEDLLRGQPTSPSLVARTANAPGGSVYGDLDVPALWSHIASIMPPEMRKGLPQLDPAIARVTFWDYDAGDLGYQRLQIPLRLISAIRAVAK